MGLMSDCRSQLFKLTTIIALVTALGVHGGFTTCILRITGVEKAFNSYENMFTKVMENQNQEYDATLRWLMHGHCFVRILLLQLRYCMQFEKS